MISMSSRRLSLLLGATLLTSACAVGPNYHQPDIKTPSAYFETRDAGKAPLSRAVPAQADLSQWWKQFNDPVLNDLVVKALAQNLNLRAATDRLREARQSEIVAGAAGLPTVSANGTVARVNTNSKSDLLSSVIGDAGTTTGAAGTAATAADSVSTPSHLNLFAANFDSTWEVDIFGGVRRGVEEAQANTQAAVWQRRDGEVSLTAEVANDYVMLRSLQAQIAIAQAEAKTQEANFTIIQQQAKTGFVTRLNVNQQTAQLESTVAQIPALQAQARVQIHALGVLLGMDPNALDSQLNPAAHLPAAPGELPVGLPSDLLLRRPDVRRAERQLAAATAGVGVQVANLYPKFNILAVGPAFASTTTNHLFDAGNAASLGAGMISWPIFEGGRIRAGIRSAKASADEAYLTYQQTILSALQNVEDDLARYASDQQRIIALRKSTDAADNSLTIARQQYQVGLVTYINILQAQETLLSDQNQLAQANAQLVQDMASLYTALGGGWSADEGAALRKSGVSWP
ncbi:MAG: efflux transporter outer membrane subunit [Caulobacteraceae bacterium]